MIGFKPLLEAAKSRALACLLLSCAGQPTRPSAVTSPCGRTQLV